MAISKERLEFDDTGTEFRGTKPKKVNGCNCFIITVIVIACFVLLGWGLGVGLLKDNEKGEAEPIRYTYVINTTWDGKKVAHDTVNITLISGNDDVRVDIKAPFFNDPADPGGTPEKPFPGLWNYEVVELFFLNDGGQYMELILSPHGQYLVIHYISHREMIKDQLPLEFNRSLSNMIWSGEAVIPSGYFPVAVTKMNAYYIYGSGDKRIHEALYPMLDGKYTEPDLHRLEYFQPIDFVKLLPSNSPAEYTPSVWFVYEITRTWNDLPTNHSVIQFTLVSHEQGVKILMKAPFFNDPTNPGGPPGEPFPGLWDYEVVEMFFLNDQEHYIELEFCPHGQHLLLLLNGYRSAFKEQLPLNFTSTIINNNTWSGEAVIPSGYFPKAVTKMNAYAIHGSDEDRIYEALYPTPYGKYPEPDFHRLEYFMPIDFIQLDPSNDGENYSSDVWFVYEITRTWNDLPTNHSVIQFTLVSQEQGVKILMKAPFFNDPTNPGGPPGEPFPGLWDYEVVEMFFLNDQEHYIELEFCPHGQHLLLLLNGYRSAFKEQLPLNFTSTIINNNTWSGEAVIPSGYFPKAVTKMNAYAIHGSDEDRIYEALYPTPYGKYPEPDFHRLEYFMPIDFIQLDPSNDGENYSSDVWFVYEITRTWNDLPTNHSVIQFTLVSHEQGVKILMKAPFFNDPPNPGGPPGEPFPGLWDYEVVEMFFLNDQEHYIELEFCPHGQHLLLLLNGYRSAFKEQLPLNFTSTIINNNTWSGEAVIPSGYFPKAVTKMNAYAIHGSDEDRIYEALYPTPYGKYPEPDFHRLEYFMPIDFIQLDPSNDGENYSSDVWFVYEITRTWNDLPTNHSVIQFTLVSHEQGVKILMKAPFFNDPPNPGGPPGEPLPGLWDYEVVEMFFLNDQEHYIELEFCPHGQHLLLLLNGYRSAFKEQLPLNFTSTIINNNTWSGEAVIPSGYFPKAVTKMNAYAIHGSDEDRIYEALYPTPYGKYPEPDFHRLEYFMPIDFIQLDPSNDGENYSSDVWFVYEITRTWNDLPTNHSVIQFTLVSHEQGVKILMKAPFFNDPPNPGGPPGEPFPGLWDYEVVEMFFLNDQEHYIELEFCPHGQHLLLLLNGYRSAFKEQLPLNFTSTIINNNTWSGEAVIPSGYFPKAVTKMNAYAIHGSDEDRIYEALYPTPYGKYPEPDFHRLEYFMPIDFIQLDPSNDGENYSSDVWFVYEITRTWNDLPTNHSVIQFTLVSHEQGVKILMKAPFFNDPTNPGGPPGEPFPGLWDYEVVEMFFLNDQEHYIELEFCPHGQHLLLLLNGYRSAFKEQLPLNFTSTIINNNTWSGEAVIPSGYFPKAVTKMNAYAIHGSDEDRIYEALYPTPYGKYPEPDFHRLEYFMPIDFIQLDPSNDGENYSSDVWFVYEITRTWNDLPTNHSVIQFTLVSHEQGVKILMKAPFFNDPPNPGGPPGEPLPGLWDYEVVEMFFLNDQEHYIELEFCPHGQHLLLLLNGYRSAFKEQLPLNFTSTIINNNTWSGEAVIPSGYFPKAVTKMNAYAIHGSDEDRIYEALYPTPYGKYPEPDFHRLEYFMPIDLIQLDPSNDGENYSSDVWFVYEITRTWNDLPTNHSVIQFTLVSHEQGVKILMKAPFFNDPPNPGGPPGEPFPGLWEYEVVEMFFLNDEGCYVELEFCPHGQHLVLLLNGTKQSFMEQLPLNFTSTIINNNTWSGEAVIPSGYFPKAVTKMNAYAIHGSDEDRIYEALYPTPYGKYPEPDFHRLEYFEDIEFVYLDPTNVGDLYESSVWQGVC